MLRVGFAGTPDFAVPTLQALIEAPDLDLQCVYTQPDRPAGRGRKLSESAVKQCARAAELEILQPETLKSAEAIEAFTAFGLDVFVVVAYGQILKPEILQAPRFGCINVHASLLPRWRGAAPLQRAIEAGDHTTGISIMQMDAGLDTGPILAMETVPITDQTTTERLHHQLAILGGQMIVPTLRALTEGRLIAQCQPETGVTYAAKIQTEDALIDWNRPRAQVLRHIHAFNPVPGAFTYLNGERFKIFEVARAPGVTLNPGELQRQPDHRLLVGTSDGALQILDCQLAGAKRIGADHIHQLSHASWAQHAVLASTPS